MPRLIASYVFQGTGDADRYQTDFGEFVDGLTFRVEFNENIDVSRAQTYGTTVNAQLTRYLEFTDPNLLSPCPIGSIVDGRRLVFTLGSNDQGRRTISIVARDTATLLTVRDELIGLLESDYGTVQCVDLVGERVPDMGLFFGSYNFDGSVLSGAGTSYYTERINYVLDGGGSIVLPIRILSNNSNSPPPIFNNAQAIACLGTIVSSGFSCGSVSNVVDHRRLIVQYQTVGDAVETRELPVAETSLISDCANNFVGLVGVGCVSYIGTRDRRFHLRQPQTAS